jgi:hypothetical protein
LVISCSGNCAKEDKEMYLQAGADNVWPKPYPAPPAMLKDLQAWIGQKEPPVKEGDSLPEGGACIANDASLAKGGSISEKRAWHSKSGQRVSTPGAMAACSGSIDGSTTSPL